MAKILIAEDDLSMRQFLTMALERADHNVESYEDGLSAFTALEEKSFDLLLADIVMPGMDGIELSQKALKLHPDLKVLFITGFAAVVAGQKQDTQANILPKPFHLNDLVKQVEDLLAA